ncbi:MAG: DUF86 domain-containing protein [Bacteroidota bacterium]
MSKRDNRLLLADIIEATSKISRYTHELSLESFLADEKTIDAVARNLEIVGEAYNQLTEEFRANHSVIPWRQLTGLRNRIIHEYFGVDLEIIWEIIQNDLKKLMKDLNEIGGS